MVSPIHGDELAFDGASAALGEPVGPGAVAGDHPGVALVEIDDLQGCRRVRCSQSSFLLDRHSGEFGGLTGNFDFIVPEPAWGKAMLSSPQFY